MSERILGLITLDFKKLPTNFDFANLLVLLFFYVYYQSSGDFDELETGEQEKSDGNMK